MRKLASVCCERAWAMVGWYTACTVCRRPAIRWFKRHFPALSACIWTLPNANKPAGGFATLGSASAALHWTARLPSSLPKEPQPLLVNNWTRFTLLLLLSWSLQSYKRRFFSTRLCGTPWPPGAVLSMKQKRCTWWMRRRDRRNWELQLQPRKPCSDQKQNLEPEHSLLPDPEGRHEWIYPFLWPSSATDSGSQWCPQYNGILDTFSLYANPSMAGGQKTFRHTAVRDTLYLRKSVRGCCSHRNRRIWQTNIAAQRSCCA